MINKILPLAKQLITIESTQHNREGLYKVLDVAQKGLNKNLSVEKFEKDGERSLLIHNAPLGTKHFRMLFNAHLDVISANPSDFEPKEQDGKLFGRGAYDMKAAAAVMIVLLNNLSKKITFPLALQLVTDEEYSGEYGTGYQLEQGITTDFALTGECGSNFQIKHKGKGHMAIQLTATGVSSHGAYPWLGENAIMYIHEALDRIQKLYPKPSNPLWGTFVTVSRIESSNKIHNRVPDDCTAYLDVRFIPEDKEQVLEHIRQSLPKKVTMKVNWMVSSHFTDPDHEDLLLLRTATKKVTGHLPTIQEAQAASDMRLFTQVGIPSVEFGPVGANHHADHEWIDIKQLEEYYRILEQFLLTIK